MRQDKKRASVPFLINEPVKEDSLSVSLVGSVLKLQQLQAIRTQKMIKMARENYGGKFKLFFQICIVQMYYSFTERAEKVGTFHSHEKRCLQNDILALPSFIKRPTLFAKMATISITVFKKKALYITNILIKCNKFTIRRSVHHAKPIFN